MAKLWLVVAGVILALAAVVFYQYQKNKRLQLVIDGTEKRILLLETGLSTLKSQETKNRDSIETLLRKQDDIRQVQAEQQNAFTRLQNDYATVKDWSDVLLPAELTSLLNRPARTGYRGGDPAMRAGDTVSSSGVPATKNR